MKSYSTLLLIACLFLVYPSYSQIKGKCIDEYGKGIPYVNISVKGKAIGTVSNLEGNFSIENTSVTENDYLIFSHMNFDKKTISISLKKDQILLNAKVENLKEVIVSNKKRKVKEKIVGTKTETESILINFTSNSLGTEIGKIITVKKNKVYDLKNVQFNLPELGYKSATFRINFYTIVEGTIDLVKINRTENVVTVTKSGMAKLDLSNQDLSFESEFLVAVEWIDFENKENITNQENAIKFSSAVFSGPYVSRDNINLKWENEKLMLNIGPGIHLKVKEYSK
ncbi:carboxypeptidase-like regulatory domain-containing protein [Flavobacterium sp. ALD4]|uniref:carboxypeptidase-like regulatory domain-containing protein n=1 Tax=Flavobacterium sp. ALD4 TaxID=2058314 RepID=UPI001E3FF86F|nr:carboxypeptidase-like regulatory domain-containing protein [Flavobacterium sp. ALD4]